MNARSLLILGLTLMFSAQAQTVSDSATCEARGRQLHGAEKASFLKSCLAQVLAQSNSPEHRNALRTQEKRNTCEQNARNMKLEGSKKTGYLNDCINSNNAAAEAKKTGGKEHAASANPARTHAASRSKTSDSSKKSPRQTENPPVPTKPKVSLATCTKQADLDQLKGQARKQFIHDCRKPG